MQQPQPTSPEGSSVVTGEPPTWEATTETTTGGQLDRFASDVRFRASRHIFRTMLGTSGAAAVLAHYVLPKKHWLLPDRRSIWSFAKLQARNLARLVGVTVTVRGAEKITSGGPYIITPNHQSHFDIVALLGFLPGHSRFATKKELFRDPILGPVLKTMGMIPIDRDRPLTAIERLRTIQGADWSLVMFPEGTRGGSGAEDMLPFKKGAFVTAIQLGIPVVPVAIRGSGAVMPKGGYLGIRPGRIEIIASEPLPTHDLSYDDRTQLSDRVRATIARHLA
jgi:1-acyl-sn-glycerol-3-phosphate acyltransferase